MHGPQAQSTTYSTVVRSSEAEKRLQGQLCCPAIIMAYPDWPSQHQVMSGPSAGCTRGVCTYTLTCLGHATMENSLQVWQAPADRSCSPAVFAFSRPAIIRHLMCSVMANGIWTVSTACTPELCMQVDQ